jgi:hypothetical protein
MQLFFSLKHKKSTDSIPHYYTGNIFFVKINTVMWFQGEFLSSVGGGKRIYHQIAAIHFSKRFSWNYLFIYLFIVYTYQP